MNTMKLLLLIMIETVVLSMSFGCASDLSKPNALAETYDIHTAGKAADTEGKAADTEGKASNEYRQSVNGDYMRTLNPVNGNYILAEISGEGTLCGEFTRFDCRVKRKMIDEKTENLQKLYVPNSAVGSINGYKTLLAAVHLVSSENGLISEDVRSYSVSVREDGSLCCIPFDENGAAVVDDMHYLDLRYGDSSEFMVNGLNTTPYQYAFAEKSEKDIYSGKVSEDESIFDSIRRKHEKKYYDSLLEVLPDYLIESGTAEKDAEKYFDALETARQLEDELYSGISEEALEF